MSACDIWVRVFERPLVLANPIFRPDDAVPLGLQRYNVFADRPETPCQPLSLVPSMMGKDLIYLRISHSTHDKTATAPQQDMRRLAIRRAEGEVLTGPLRYSHQCEAMCCYQSRPVTLLGPRRMILDCLCSVTELACLQPPRRGRICPPHCMQHVCNDCQQMYDMLQRVRHSVKVY